MSETTHLGVSEVADRLGVRPTDISPLFYTRVLDVDRCPIIAGRRLVPVDYLPAIEIELRRRGKLPPLPKKAVAHAR